jgi:hypothetical protein
MGVDAHLHAERKEFEGRDSSAILPSSGAQNLGGGLKKSRVQCSWLEYGQRGRRTSAHSAIPLSRQITIQKSQDSARDSPSCLATVLGLKDVSATTPYGRGWHYPCRLAIPQRDSESEYQASRPPSPAPSTELICCARRHARVQQHNCKALQLESGATASVQTARTR